MSEDHQEEWGPWIEHDGLSCPVMPGQICHVVNADGGDEIGTPETDLNACPPGCSTNWIWATLDAWQWEWRIVRYRIRKPRGLQILETLLNDLPEPAPRQPERVGA